MPRSQSTVVGRNIQDQKYEMERKAGYWRQRGCDRGMGKQRERPDRRVMCFDTSIEGAELRATPCR